MRANVSSLLVLALSALLVLGCQPKEAKQAKEEGATKSRANTAKPNKPVQADAKAPAAKATKTRASLPGGKIKSGKPHQVGFILWGGDYPLFYGNGGLRTREGTIFDKYGLNIELVPGDDFSAQLAEYKAKRRHVLRGTFGMIFKHNSSLCADPELCPSFFLQETLSAGDHLVCRDNVKEVADLKGKTIAIQRNGPHEMFLFVVLTEDAKLQWADVKLEWLPNITGKNSPPELFRKDSKVDCAFGVTPDMVALAGGVTSKGTGAENTVKGAHVVASTQHRRQTIADGFAVSAGFAKSNPQWVRKFTAAYLESMEKLIELKKTYEASGGSKEFLGLLASAVEIYTPDVLPNADEAFGLFLDASFVGHAGNVKFFDPKNPVGISHYSDLANDLAAALGTATGGARKAVAGSPIDWSHSVFSGLKSANLTAAPRLRVEATRLELEEMHRKGVIADNTVMSFTAYFDEDQTVFDQTKYKQEFDDVIKVAQRYTRAPIVIRGHVDSAHIVAEIIRAGMRAKEIEQSGSRGNFSYSRNGELLSLDNIGEWLKLLGKPGYTQDAAGNDLSELVRQADKMSARRAEALRTALLKYAKSKGVTLDESQIQVNGAGVREPFVVKPRSPAESAKNRRAQFSVVKVSVEAATSSDYEL